MVQKVRIRLRRKQPAPSMPKTRIRLRFKKKPLIRQTGQKSLQCRTDINRRSRRITNRNPLNNRNGNSVIPNKYFCTLPYFDQVQPQLSTTNLNYYFYNINSLYDPDFSGTGHQPRGYDQLKNLYTGYQVYGVAYDITAYTNEGTEEGFMVGIVGVPNNFTGFASIQDAHEYTRSPIYWTECSNQKPVTRIKGYLSAADSQSVSKKDYAVGVDFKAGVGASPSIMPKLAIVVHTLDGTTASKPPDFNVNLLYFSKLESPVELAGS